ncbi:MAG: type III-A CRISPR-associated RAMP protein Csm5 [Bacteroidota bacterium]
MKSTPISYPLTVRPLSPLHIGSGEQLSSTGEFFLSNHHAFLLDNDRLMLHLREQGLLRTYVEQIQQQGRNFDFYKSLSDLAVDPAAFSRRKLPFHQDDQQHITLQNNQLRLCLKTGEQPYLPGSSFKGMLRSALLYAFLQSQPGEKASLVREVEQLLDKDNPLVALRMWVQDLEREWLDHSGLSRALRPSDSRPLPADELVVEQIVRQHFYGENSDGLDWLCECIPIDSRLELELSWWPDLQSDLLQLTKGDVMLNLLDCIRQFYRDQIEWEIELLRTATHKAALQQSLLSQLAQYREKLQEDNPRKCLVRLGQGQTLFFHTLLLWLPQALQKKILALRHPKHPGPVFPLSRSITARDGLALGWAELHHPPRQWSLPDNQLAQLIAKTTELEVRVTATKKVGFLLNGEAHREVDLVLFPKKMEHPAIGSLIRVTVNQLKKDNKSIVQVKYNKW